MTTNKMFRVKEEFRRVFYIEAESYADARFILNQGIDDAHEFYVRDKLDDALEPISGSMIECDPEEVNEYTHWTVYLNENTNDYDIR